MSSFKIANDKTDNNHTSQNIVTNNLTINNSMIIKNISSDSSLTITTPVINFNTSCILFNTGIIPFVTDMDIQNLNASGAVSVTTYSTTIDPINPSVIVTLADGDYKGRLKKINQLEQAGTNVSVFATLEGGTNINFTSGVIAWCTLLWNGTSWRAIELANAALV